MISLTCLYSSARFSSRFTVSFKNSDLKSSIYSAVLPTDLSSKRRVLLNPNLCVSYCHTFFHSSKNLSLIIATLSFSPLHPHTHQNPLPRLFLLIIISHCSRKSSSLVHQRSDDATVGFGDVAELFFLFINGYSIAVIPILWLSDQLKRFIESE